MKKVMKKKNYSNRFIYFLVTLGIFTLLAGGVYAISSVSSGANSGHPSSDIDFSKGISGVGNIVSTGSVTAVSFLYSSDKSLKTNIAPIPNALERLQQLNGVSFNWKATGRADDGLIAQDIEKVFPELVSTDKNGLKSVEYGNLVGVLVEAIKEQQKQIDELKSKLAK